MPEKLCSVIDSESGVFSVLILIKFVHSPNLSDFSGITTDLC